MRERSNIEFERTAHRLRSAHEISRSGATSATRSQCRRSIQRYVRFAKAAVSARIGEGKVSQ